MEGRLLVALFALAPAAAAAANEAPDVEVQSFDTDEDKPLAATLKAQDDDGDPLTFRLAKPPKNGAATIEPGGKLSYTPKPDFNGKDALTFDVSDGKSSTTGTVEILVSSVNDRPAAPPVQVAGQEDRSAEGRVTAKDADGDPLRYELGDAPPQGTVDVDGAGHFTFTPAPNQAGAIKFTIKVSDGTVAVDVPVTVTLAPSNDPPTFVEELLKTDEDQPAKGKLRVVDPDGDALTFTVTSAPKHGTFDMDAASGAYTYAPAKDYAGDDAFGFSVGDGKATLKGKVDVEVRNINDPPTIAPLAVEGVEDAPAKGKVVAKDPDGDAVQFKVKVEPKHGDVEIDVETGAFQYVPKPDWFGADGFVVEASDVYKAAAASVTVTIKPQNDAPVAVSDELTGPEDAPLVGKLRASDVDKDGLRFAATKQPKNGTLELRDDGTVRFAPPANFHGEDAFVFEVTDGKAKAQGTVKLVVKPQNDAPTTTDVRLATKEDAPVKGSVVGVDVDKDALSYAVAKPPQKGKVELDAERGTFVYLPSPDQSGDDAFSVEVSDGPAKAAATITVAIAAVNDAPVAKARADQGDEDQPIRGTVEAADVDADALTYAIVQRPKRGTVELNAQTGAYAYTPAPHAHGADAFRFEASDGKARAAADVQLTVVEVNDPPEVKAVAVSAVEDKPATGVVVASDVDKDKLTWSEAKAPQKGKVVVEPATGKFTYTPNPNENGDDAFVLAVADGRGATTQGTVTVAIAKVNDAPLADAHEARTAEDAPLQGRVTGSDVDQDKLTYVAIGKPRIGSVVVDPGTGAYTYTPNPDSNGADAFRFEVSDGALRATAEVKVVVDPVNDAPVPKDLTIAAVEDREATGKLAATDVDPDVLTFRLKQAPKQGTALVDDATGALRYVPARDVHGPDTFVVEASDGFLTADATVSVTVAPAPDEPVVDRRAIETAEDEPVVAKLAAHDADGEDVTFKILTQPRLGAAQIEGDGKTLRYTPRADVHGEDEVVVEASDGKSRVRAAVLILVAARNDPPTIDAAAAETLEETAVTVALVARDRDGDPVKVALAAAAAKKGPEPATLTGNLLRVVPPKDFAGPLEVTVTPSDPSGPGAPVKVVVTVVNVNDPPVAKDVELRAADGKPASGVVEASDGDVGDALVFSIAVPPRQGSATIDDAGRFTYTPAAGSKGVDGFRVRVKDKAGASATATVRVSLGAGSTPTAVKPAKASGPAAAAPVKATPTTTATTK